MRIAWAMLLAYMSCHVGARHSPQGECPWSIGISEPICDAGYHGDEPVSKAQQAAQAADNDASLRAGWSDAGLCAQDYCLHAYPAFSNGRGISVISTRANIARIKALVSELESSSSQSQDSPPPPPPPFYLSPVSGKGLGLVANATLRRGDPVMSLAPVVVVHRGFLESLAPAAQQPLLEAAVSLLPPATRSLFMGQMAHSGGGREHRVAPILATNSFQTDLGGGGGPSGGDGHEEEEEGHHYTNYPEASRFNHDCRPNVAFRIDDNHHHGAAAGGGGLVHRTTAVRDVQPGEELAITYLDSFAPRAARRARSLRAWGFACACAQCRLPEDERAAAESDARLESIGRVQRRLEDWRSGRDVTPGLIARWVAWHEQERLQFAMAGAYTLAALNYNMLGEEERAVEHAALAVEAGGIEYGPEAGDVREMEALMADPRGHFTWRKRLPA